MSVYITEPTDILTSYDVDNQLLKVYVAADGEIKKINEIHMNSDEDNIVYPPPDRPSSPPDSQNTPPAEQTHYYHQNGVEAWEIIDQVMEFHEDSITNKEAGLLYNIMKYLLRYPYKGYPPNDLRKAKKYIEELIEEVE